MLKKCEACGTENVIDPAGFCKECGALIINRLPKTRNELVVFVELVKAQVKPKRDTEVIELLESIRGEFEKAKSRTCTQCGYPKRIFKGVTII